MVGWSVPIEPMRRYEHYFEAEQPIEPLPYIKDVNRLAFRPEGKGYSGGLPDLAEPRGFNFEVDHGYFERVVWPALAHRFATFERTKLRSTMPGLYDQNELDGNMIIGPWTGHIENFYLLAGFSGHGLMHAPGCGCAIAELILDGGYRTLDLSRFGWQRVEENRPYRERGIT
jgi:glycine/D-amino acid oxidase-like deaminating enzyme